MNSGLQLEHFLISVQFPAANQHSSTFHRDFSFVISLIFRIFNNSTSLGCILGIFSCTNFWHIHFIHICDEFVHVYEIQRGSCTAVSTLPWRNRRIIYYNSHIDFCTCNDGAFSEDYNLSFRCFEIKANERATV